MLGHLVVLLSLIIVSSPPIKVLAESYPSGNGTDQIEIAAASSEADPQLLYPSTTDQSQSIAQSMVPPDKVPLREEIRPLEPVTNVSNTNKSISISPTTLGPLVQVASLSPIRLDATYNEPVSLRDCLLYAMSENLPIKISRESYIYQLYTFYSNLALFLPSNNLGWNLVRNSVGPSPNNSVARSRVFSEIVRFPVFQGGYVFYNALAQFYREKGWHKALDATVNDTLLAVYNNYNKLLLNEALLQIRSKSVAVSEAQLALNEKMLKAGKGTRFAIMQSDTQLESDRAALLQQQVDLRAAAINLSFVVNGPMAINLIPVEDNVIEASLVDEKATVEDLIREACAHRPELRQYELFGLAANRTIPVAAAPLLPNAAFFTGYTHASTSVSGSENISGAGVFGGLFNTGQVGFIASQTLSGAGLPAVMNVYAARALARQALYQANQELMSIVRDIRIDYLGYLTARQKIQTTTLELSSAQEALRMARVRVQAGAGTNLELIEAHRDYVSAQIKQAQAIISSNQAQAQILHDTGMISIDTLTGDHRSLKPNSR